jgi:hypothetical protein
LIIGFNLVCSIFVAKNVLVMQNIIGRNEEIKALEKLKESHNRYAQVHFSHVYHHFWFSTK